MDPERLLWDVAVVGAGMGGAAAGYALAKAGHSVIFLEKGEAAFPGADGTLGLAHESPAERLRKGCWPTRLTGRTDAVEARFFAPLGCGAGGSTLLYAAALERFEPSDFAGPPDPRGLSHAWPVSFDEMRPYYREAERLFQVRGTPDPLHAGEGGDLLEPPPLNPCDQHFLDSFKAGGLHPYRLHVSYGYQPGCRECGGFICPRNCKVDARNACVDPALRTGRAQLLDRCEVERLEADASAVRSIACRREGRALSIRARIVLLAAGALFSPVLLLRSAGPHWPQGLANGSGLVGRNLMFHVSDLLAVWPRGRYAMHGARKTLAFRDLYGYRDVKLGSIQSTGFTAGYGNIVHFLKGEFDRSRWRWLKPVRPLLRIPAVAAALLFGRATIFATIMEDLPYRENRVVPDPQEPSGMRFEYTVHPELRQRVRLFRKLYREALARHRLLVLSPEVSLNYGHPCGTCRFGADPGSSVLDAHNRAHEVDNLYVVDASFMPSSGGANPSLTIAANALRVAAHVSERLRAAAPGALGQAHVSGART